MSAGGASDTAFRKCGAMGRFELSTLKEDSERDCGRSGQIEHDIFSRVKFVVEESQSENRNASERAMILSLVLIGKGFGFRIQLPPIT